MPNVIPRWRVLVADDEPAARRGVRQLLAAHPTFEVVGECRDGVEVLAALDRDPIDVVFLDVQMPEVDGFDVITRRADATMPVIVFLTAYDQFAIRAFEAEAIDYLVKPVTAGRFDVTMRRIAKRLGRPDSEPSNDALVVSNGRATVILAVHEIEWIESADNYARVWSGAKSYLLRRPMRALDGMMRSHGFARAHRRAIVRIAAVRKLVTTQDGDTVAVLVSGAEIPIARRRRVAFAAALAARAVS